MRYLPDEVFGALATPRLASTQAVATPGAEQIVSMPALTTEPKKTNWLLWGGLAAAALIAYFVFKKKGRK